MTHSLKKMIGKYVDDWVSPSSVTLLNVRPRARNPLSINHGRMADCMVSTASR